MNYSKNSVGLPKIPQVLKTAEKVDPPKGKGKAVKPVKEFEHTWELVYHFLVVGFKNIKKILKMIMIPLAIAMVINIALHTIPTYSLTGIIRPIAFFFIFITSSYNSIIPRTLFWVILFTIGKKMALRIKKEGFSTTMMSLKTLPDVIKTSREGLGKSFLFVMVATSGVGFVAANFLTRNNRFDKVAILFVLVISLLDTLSKGNQTTIFTALRLIHKDLSGMLKKTPYFTDNHVYIAIIGFTEGLLGNLIFGVLKMDFGGYVLGSVLLLVGLTLIHTNIIGVKEH